MALKMANTTNNFSLGKNKNFKLPNLQPKKTIVNTKNLDDSYTSTPEEKAEPEKTKKKANFFAYEQKAAEDQQYHTKRINDIHKLELNFLRKPDRVGGENSNNQQDYSEMYYQYLLFTYVMFFYTR